MQHASADPHAGQAGGQPGHAGRQAGKGRHYLQLLLMALLSYVAMYWLMYAMVDRFANVFHNLNQAYMAGLMTAPMVLIELWVMRGMYPDRRRNAAIVAATVALGLLCWFGIRQQAGIGDHQFLRSMIPHHAGAILMCEEAPVRDAEVRALCSRITASQEREIAQMKALLAR
jgi:hypothetical protein